ncbi:MAG: ABC transporter permease [Vicinamibacterales bacterium]
MMFSGFFRVLDRIRALFRASELDADFAQELHAHVEMLTDDNAARGMTRDEARRRALVSVGGRTSLQQQHRETRGFQAIEAVVQDTRFAFRLIAKERWFSAAAVAAIALGIGANTLGFTIVNAAFLRGFAFDRADRLFAVSWTTTSGRTGVSQADLDDWRAQGHSFAGLAGYSFSAINISDDSSMPEQTQGSWVTAGLFSVLHQPPLIGRDFEPGEDQPGAEPVVIIGYDIWKNRYNSDPGVLGRTLRVNGQPSTIVGVMPAKMKFPENSEMWVARAPTGAQRKRSARQMSVFGRLADGASREAATAELNGIAQQMIAAYPDDSKNLAGIRLETLVERFLGGAARPMFITVMGAVMFVLLIACANVANLLLSRSIYRAREIAVRFSMGATRWRIVRQLLVESIVLSSLGGVLGLALATVGVGAFNAAVQTTEGVPYWLVFTIDYRVLAYVAAICVGTGVLFGLAPALHVSKNNNHDVLKEGGRGTAGNRRAQSFSTGMVVAELALTVVLLCGAGLMIRSFSALYSVDTGILVDGLMRMKLQLPPARYPTADDRNRFFQQLEPRLSAIPGVAAAVTTGVPPLDGEERRLEVDSPSRSVDPRPVFVSTVIVTPRYFEVLGVPMTAGRAFTQDDGAAGAECVIINRQLAEEFFPGEEPVGRRIRFVRRDGDDDIPAPNPVWRTIVGVSGRVLQGSPRDAYRNAVVYIPFRQEPPRTASLLVRSAIAPAMVMAAVRREVQAVDQDQPVFTIQAVAQLIEDEQSIYRIFAVLFAVLAIVCGDGLRRDPTDAGDRRAHGGGRTAMASVVDLPQARAPPAGRWSCSGNSGRRRAQQSGAFPARRGRTRRSTHARCHQRGAGRGLAGRVPAARSPGRQGRSRSRAESGLTESEGFSPRCIGERGL